MEYLKVGLSRHFKLFKHKIKVDLPIRAQAENSLEQKFAVL